MHVCMNLHSNDSSYWQHFPVVYSCALTPQYPCLQGLPPEWPLYCGHLLEGKGLHERFCTVVICFRAKA
eukprot:241924-Pelagomonas_calceolata.AAC.1